mmetsp:Transcript_110377/g.263045  ORF Transcript_110377/g.263045 Transcript_110377/m.263045 type:complete len:318 (+) Transcript_110377:1469-2422(+)
MSLASLWSPSLDCLLNSGALSIHDWLLLTAAAPVALWCFTAICIAAKAACTQTFKAEVLKEGLIQPSIVVVTCFLPGIMGSAARFVPCVHFMSDKFLEKVPRYVSCALGTPCTDVRIMRYVLLVAFSAMGAVVGPFFWRTVISRSKEWPEDARKETLGFLVAGYRKDLDWWEAVVLTRKCALVMAGSMFPASYSPFLFLTFELIIIGASLTLHSYAKPYDDASLNAMELGTLFASATAILSAVVLTLQPIDWTLDSSINKPTLAVFTGSIAVPAAVLMLLLAQEVILGFLGSSTAESASSTVEESTVKDVGVQTAGT